MAGELQNAQIAIEILVKLRDRLNENLDDIKHTELAKEQIEVIFKNYELILKTHSHLTALLTAYENSGEFKNLPQNSSERENVDRLKRNAALLIDYVADIRTNQNSLPGRFFESQKNQISNYSENYLKDKLKAFNLTEKYPFANQPDHTGERWDAIKTNQIKYSEFFSDLIEKSVDEINFTDLTKATWLNEIKRLQSYKSLPSSLLEKLEKKEKSNSVINELRSAIDKEIHTIMQEDIPVINKMDKILVALRNEQRTKTLKENGFPEEFFIKEFSRKGNLRQFFMDSPSEIHQQLNTEILALILKTLASQDRLLPFISATRKMQNNYELFFYKEYITSHLTNLNSSAKEQLNKIIEKNINTILASNESTEEKLGNIASLIKDIPKNTINEKNQLELADAVLKLTSEIVSGPNNDYTKLEILQKTYDKMRNFHNIVNNDAIFIDFNEKLSKKIEADIIRKIDAEQDPIKSLNIILYEIDQIKISKQEEPMTDRQFIESFPNLGQNLNEIRDYLIKSVVKDLTNNPSRRNTVDFLSDVNRVMTEMPFTIPHEITATCAQIKSNITIELLQKELNRIIHSKEISFVEKIRQCEIINRTKGLDNNEYYQKIKSELAKNVNLEIDKIMKDLTLPINIKMADIDTLAAFAGNKADSAWLKASTQLTKEYSNQLTEIASQDYKHTSIEKLVTYSDRAEFPIAQYAINLENYVGNNIISEPDVNIRTKRMSRWINIANDSIVKGDFCTSMAIFSALHSLPNQLHLTKLNLPAKDKKILAQSLKWAQENNLGWWEKINNSSGDVILHMSFLGSRIDKCAPNKEKWDGTNIPTVVVAPMMKSLTQLEKTKPLASQQEITHLRTTLAKTTQNRQTLEAFKNLYEPATNEAVRNAKIANREEEENIALTLKSPKKSEKPSTTASKTTKEAQLNTQSYNLQAILQKLDTRIAEKLVINRLVLESALNQLDKNSAHYLSGTLKPLKLPTEDDWNLIREKLPNLGLPIPVPRNYALTSDQFNKINQIFKFQDKINENGYKFSFATYDGKNYKNNDGNNLTGTFEDLFIFKDGKLYKRDLATQKQLIENLPKNGAIADQVSKSLVEINDMINIDLRKILSAPTSQFSQPTHRIDTINTYFYLIAEKLNNLNQQLETMKTQPGYAELAKLLQAEKNKYQELQSFVTKDLLNPSLISSFSSTITGIFKKDNNLTIKPRSDSSVIMHSILNNKSVHVLQTSAPTSDKPQQSSPTSHHTTRPLAPPQPGTIAARAAENLKQKGRMEPIDREDVENQYNSSQYKKT